MRFLLFSLALASATPAAAGPPQLLLRVASFRNLDQVQKGGEVEISVTVPTQPLTYRQRAPKSFQSSAVVDLSILKADGTAAWQETVTLKPPVLSDTTISIKNPLSFLKRVNLPDGTYTLRGRIRDQYRSANGETTVEQPLVVAAPKGAAFSDLVFLAKPAVKTTGEGVFNRGGYLLTRSPAGFYGRGADNVFFYTELNQLPAGRPVRLHYHLAAADGSAADADAAPITPQEGRPTPVVGQLPLGPLPAGPFTLTVEARDAATKKVVATQSQTGERSLTDYAPAGAAVPR
ncbi:hypothetical protein GO988_00245 [Hymenobacter sp. HMF4947]|uniref:Macroglobulin domain-containing protein n=1 Tax=Hymenobacter ginkgonis TaxID=2682976 RepID=A0A7K1T8M9_9BACT|nr:hypothetical protein [Hymenobacter ginkgonis]MVN74750.1 hypothetical protein [Hymenobacter ginkgonis]